MKTLVLLVMITFMSTQNAQALTDESIVPILKYDPHYHLDEHNHKISSDYLVVVPEETRFFEGSQKNRFERALSILEDVLNSEEFKYRVLAYMRSSDGKRAYQKNYLWNNEDQRLSNEDVYALIMEGNEYMRPNTFGEMNINSYVKACRWYEEWKTWCRGVIGSTNPRSSKWIAQNWKFYKTYLTSQMVANIVHEWLHLLGFLHGEVNMREEVPYVVGSIAGQVAEEYLAARGIAN